MIALIEKYWPLGFLVTLVVVTADYYLYKSYFFSVCGYEPKRCRGLLFGAVSWWERQWQLTTPVNCFYLYKKPAWLRRQYWWRGAAELSELAPNLSQAGELFVERDKRRFELFKLYQQALSAELISRTTPVAYQQFKPSARRSDLYFSHDFLLKERIGTL